MRQRGKECELCGARIFHAGGAESKYCHRCSINLEISLNLARGAIRSKKLSSKKESVVEVMSSDEEKSKRRQQKSSHAQFISDDSSEDEEEWAQDLKEDDDRAQFLNGGVFEWSSEPSYPIKSRTFHKMNFNGPDFLLRASTNEDKAANGAKEDVKSVQQEEERPKPAKKHKKKSKKPSQSQFDDGELSWEILHYIHNQDDYAPSDYEEVPMELAVSSDDSEISDATEHEEYDENEGVRSRGLRRVVSDEPCYMCESLSDPSGDPKHIRVQCPECDGVFHKSCAIEYGDEAICWHCAEDNLIDDSELTEADVETTNELFGVFHIKQENIPPEVVDEKDDAEDEKVDDDALPDISQVKQTILAGWKKFFDEHTVKYESDFIAATRAIEKANGFKTTLESDLHKLFQHYTNEQVKAEELSKKEELERKKDGNSDGVQNGEKEICTTNAILVNGHPKEVGSSGNNSCGEEMPKSIPAKTMDATMEIDLTSDNDDDENGLFKNTPPSKQTPLSQDKHIPKDGHVDCQVNAISTKDGSPTTDASVEKNSKKNDTPSTAPKVKAKAAPEALHQTIKQEHQVKKAKRRITPTNVPTNSDSSPKSSRNTIVEDMNKKDSKLSTPQKVKNAKADAVQNSKNSSVSTPNGAKRSVAVDEVEVIDLSGSNEDTCNKPLVPSKVKLGGQLVIEIESPEQKKRQNPRQTTPEGPKISKKRPCPIITTRRQSPRKSPTPASPENDKDIKRARSLKAALILQPPEEEKSIPLSTPTNQVKTPKQRPLDPRRQQAAGIV